MVSLRDSNGAFDFLPADGGEPHGFEEFLASVDAIVMGRNTFETVLPLQPWPYGDKRIVVLSNRPLNLSITSGGAIEQMAGPPEQIVSQLAARGIQHIYVDGGITIQRFLRAGSFNVSPSHASLCSLARAFRSSAACRMTFSSVTSALGTIPVAWSAASTM